MTSFVVQKIPSLLSNELRTMVIVSYVPHLMGLTLVNNPPVYFLFYSVVRAQNAKNPRW
jgi:hypothetical protein